MIAPARIRLVSAQPETLADFYGTALGFSLSQDIVADDPFCGRPASARCLRLGDQLVEIVRFEGREPVSERLPESNDPHFQHFAIVVGDMARAMKQLSSRADWTTISKNGPHQLPATSGGVIAFKFRDPEGHPLELLQFPKDGTPEHWKAGDSLFMGIDHTAIVVSDLQASTSFFEEFAFKKTGISLNQGPEQAGLDGLSAPVVDVATLSNDSQPPHIELLRYRQPQAGEPHTLADDSVLATRVILGGGSKGIKSPSGHRFVV